MLNDGNARAEQNSVRGSHQIGGVIDIVRVYADEPRALNEQSASRYWIPLLAAGLAFVGAILGAVLTSLLKRA
jgi:hypothetical protein